MIFEQRKTFPADNTFRIDDDDMGNTFDFQDFVHCFFSIYSVIIFDNGFFHRFNLFYRFVRNADNDDIFRKFFGNLVELGNWNKQGRHQVAQKSMMTNFPSVSGFLEIQVSTVSSGAFSFRKDFAHNCLPLLLSCANPIPLNNSMVSKIIVFFIVYQNFSIQVYPLFFQL